MDHFELCITGAGVIGLAIAEQISRTHCAKLSVVLLDQNASVGQETSSRNSEVIHAGIYYPPGSLKAQLCLQGNALLYDYCKRFDIGHKRTAKLIVGQREEREALESIAQRAKDNGVVGLRELDARQVQTLEPSVSAAFALLSPSTGIIDSHAYMQSLLFQAEKNGVQFAGLTQVLAVQRHAKGFEVLCDSGDKNNKQAFRFTCTAFINAAGLQAHQLAKKIETLSRDAIPKVHLYKGSYFKLSKRINLKHLVYPVPDSSNLGLGVHATLDLAGGVRFGPDVEAIDSKDYTVNPERADDFAEAVRRYMPWLKTEDLLPDYSGIRPKLHRAEQAAKDFLIQCEAEHQIPGLIQLFGIESPGLTASLAIAQYVDAKLAETFS